MILRQIYRMVNQRLEKKMGIHRYNYLFLLSQDAVQLSFEQFQKKRITYDTFTIETEIGRSEALSKPVESVHLHYKIKAHNITEEQLDKALQLAVKNCTIVQSVKDGIKVTETIELIK